MSTDNHPRLKKVATADRLRKKKRPRKEIPVYLDPELMDPVLTARAKFASLATVTFDSEVDDYEERKAKHEEAVDQARQELEEAEAALEEQTEYMVFESIGRKAYEDLVLAFPPTLEQKAAAEVAGDEEPPYDGDAFAPALIHACLKEPQLTDEEMTEIFEEWTNPEVMELFITCMNLCNTRQVGDLGKGFGQITA